MTGRQRELLSKMAHGDELVWLSRPTWRWMLYHASEFVHGQTVRSLRRWGWIEFAGDDDTNAGISAAGRAAIADPQKAKR